MARRRRAVGAVGTGRKPEHSEPAGRTATHAKPTLLIASPSARLRKQWTPTLQRLFAVREVSTRVELETALRPLRPAVLLLDLGLPDIPGVAIVRGLRQRSPSTAILVLAKRLREEDGITALTAGARGYCLRNIAPPLLKKAVERVQQGEIWISRILIADMLKQLASLTDQREEVLDAIADARASHGSPLGDLTPRERQIAHLLRDGLSNKEIAGHLRLTEKTVKARLTAIFRKLNLSNRLQLALFVTASKPPTD